MWQLKMCQLFDKLNEDLSVSDFPLVATSLFWHIPELAHLIIEFSNCGATFIWIKKSFMNYKISNFNFRWFSLDFAYVYLNSKLILYNHWESRLNPNWPKNPNQLLGRRNGLQRFNHFLHCFLILIFLLNKTRLSTLKRFQQKFQRSKKNKSTGFEALRWKRKDHFVCQKEECHLQSSTFQALLKAQKIEYLTIFERFENILNLRMMGD